MEKKFDLNIEEILENWEIHHAVREFIANALDEQVLSGTKNISIEKTDDVWHIRDYGRGLQECHLTQNENEEKLTHEKIIGRFGVGLKDALATLYRHHVYVRIESRFMSLSLLMTGKSGFDNIQTLHAVIDDPHDSQMEGTDIILHNCPDEEIAKAMSDFLVFNASTVLDETRYGEIIKNEGVACIYINGVKVAEEENFLFTYNITSLTAKLKKALNRERSNVGRTAYTDRVKDILLQSSSHSVLESLISDLNEFGSGKRHDEMTWQEIQLYVAQKTQTFHTDSVFVTQTDLENRPSVIDEMKKDGKRPIVIPDKLSQKMEEFNATANENEVLITTRQYDKRSEAAFDPKIISYEELSESERSIYDKSEAVLALIGGKPVNVHMIQIAETLYDSGLFRGGVIGLWQGDKHRILIKRSQLHSLQDFCGTLLHECAHAISGADDVSREFEKELTHMVGLLAAYLVR